MFVHNSWYVAATSEELGRNLLPRTFLNQPVVLFRDANGSPAALEDRCCHRNAPLSIGTLRDGCVECGYHGLLFDRSGQCIEIPSQDHIPVGASVRSYPTVERHRWIWIWMGDPTLADPHLIPFMFWHEDADWLAIFGFFHVSCNYQGLIDIQLDQTHSPFVHPGSLATKAKLKVSPSVKMEDKSLHCERIYLNADAPALWAAAGDIEGLANGWTRWEYFPPGSIMFDVGWEAVIPKEDVVPLRVRVSHGITPETNKTTHHFWVSSRNFALQDVNVTRKLSEIRETFAEDINIVQLTDRNNEHFSSASIVNLSADVPTIQARRLVKRLLEEEKGSSF